MIIWGGGSGSTIFKTGGRYNPLNNTWTATSTTAAPGARSSHTAVCDRHRDDCLGRKRLDFALDQNRRALQSLDQRLDGNHPDQRAHRPQFPRRSVERPANDRLGRRNRDV